MDRRPPSPRGMGDARVPHPYLQGISQEIWLVLRNEESP